MKTIWKIIRFLLIALLVLYVLLCGVLYFSQEKLLFRGQKLDQDHKYRSGQELNVEVDDGVSLNCLHFDKNAGKGVILYLHGNRGHIARCIRQAQMFSGNGYSVFMPDYRGYGKSDGTIISLQQLYDDVQKVYDHLRESYDESDIVVVGYSIGSGMASYLAAHNNPARLVLIAPYNSISDVISRRYWVFPDVILKYDLNNDQHLMTVRCPIQLFHGDSDEVIPTDSSENLSKIKPTQTELHILENTSHRRSIFSSVMRERLAEVLR